MYEQPIRNSMKPFGNILQTYKSIPFKNYSVILGIILGLFIVFSFRNDDAVLAKFNWKDINTVEQNSGEQNQELDNAMNQQEKYSTKYHNFLASYFLQESSVDRSKKKTEERQGLMNNLRDFHHLILSRSWSVF